MHKMSYINAKANERRFAIDQLYCKSFKSA